MDNKNETSITDLELSLVETVVSDNLVESLGSISEALLDSVLEDGVLQNIPFFDVLYKAGKIVLDVRDKLFAKKVLKFLIELKNISQHDRLKFIKELESNTGQKAGEVLIMLLERLDHMEKPKIIANLFKAQIRGDILMDDFVRFSHCVDKGFLPDLKKLESFKNMMGYGKGYYIAGTAESLYSLGLLIYTNKSEVKDTSLFKRALFGNSNDRFQLSMMGGALLKYGVKGETSAS